MKIIGITVLDNPSKFFNPFQFQITFECAEDLPEGALLLAEIYLDIFRGKKEKKFDMM